MMENWNQNLKAQKLPKWKRNMTNHECFDSKKEKNEEEESWDNIHSKGECKKRSCN